VKIEKSFSIVFVTAPHIAVARKLARTALRARLVACANLLPKIESHYWWRGKVESTAEVLIVFKTVRHKLRAFEKFIVEKHPYETPEFIVLPITMGSKPYLDWLANNVK
jgi:periplasmic divalent cation tolerance protein